MESANPFSQPGTWFKGNLHVHSTVSDGGWTPKQVMQFYRERGYHFLAFTEHDIVTPGTPVDEEFITVTGVEVAGVDPVSGLYHLVGLGGSQPPEMHGLEQISLREAIDRVNATGAIVSLAHPYWSGQMSKDLIGVEGCFAIEAFNGGCEMDDAKGYSTVHWDDLLAAGRRVGGLAVDDAHWRSGTKDAGLGWVWVKAPCLTQEAILRALEQGHYYASTGPEIHGLTWDRAENRVHVRCSPAIHIDVIGPGWRSRRVAAAPGQTLTEASHRTGPAHEYIRVVCHDALGRQAWSNPLFLDAPADARASGEQGGPQ